jgi:hypothetical protein
MDLQTKYSRRLNELVHSYKRWAEKNGLGVYNEDTGNFTHLSPFQNEFGKDVEEVLEVDDR